jgi:hypothetical protein
MICWYLLAVCSLGGKYCSPSQWGAEGGGGAVGEERKEIHLKRPTPYWSCFTLVHYPSHIKLQKQALPDILREERLRER